jgi:hypothetical protein
MNRKNLDQTLARMEHHLECWKQFNDYMSLARSKKFGQEDETQFLEIKCVLTQELELILAQLENLPITRYLSELNETNLKTLENQWHKMFINWQAVLGQLKVRREDLHSQGMFRSLFGKKERALDK